MSSQTQPDPGIAGIAHDLGNLLQVISLATGLIAEDPGHATNAAIIQRSVEKCRTILGLDQPEAFEPLSVPVARAVEHMRDYSAVNGVITPEFSINIDPHLRMRVNGPLMQRALINLFVNAAQAAANAGRSGVEVRVETEEQPDGVVLIVRDNGPGMPESLLRSAFTPRFGVHPGAGLGLRVVSAAVAACGGTISVVNLDRGGAMFTMLFPAKALSSSETAGKAGTLEPVASSFR